MSFAEWHETMRHLLANVPARQRVFASHTRFLIIAVARTKVEQPGSPKSQLVAIAAGNLER